jgi:hypothetical protein
VVVPVVPVLSGLPVAPAARFVVEPVGVVPVPVVVVVGVVLVGAGVVTA